MKLQQGPTKRLQTATIFLYCIVILATSSINTVVAFTFPEQTGPYVTGVQDMEFIDTKFPSVFAKDRPEGRRIMFRVWFPVCERSDLQVPVPVTSSELDNTTSTATSTIKSEDDMMASCGSVKLGRRRRYLEENEWLAYFGGEEPREITQTFDLTHSYLDAPPLNRNRTSDDQFPNFPVIMYMHGFGMWVSDNTALLEEIASHGYTVLAVASPGFAGGVLYPRNGEVVWMDRDYPEELAIANNATAPNPFDPPFPTDLTDRYHEMQEYLLDTSGGMAALFPRVRDDMLALADYLDEQSSMSLEDGEGGDDQALIQELLGRTGLHQVLYMGFSFGGAAAGSAAQQDTRRAVGAINIDGGHQSIDLFDTMVRVPYLAFTGTDDVMPYYYNEFFFEPVATMGQSMQVTRARIPGTTHLDFTDSKHLSQPLREAFFGLNHTVEGNEIHDMLRHFCLGFIDSYLNDHADGIHWTPDTSFTAFPTVESVDVSYVAAWAAKEDQDSVSSGHTLGCLWSSTCTIVTASVLLLSIFSV